MGFSGLHRAGLSTQYRKETVLLSPGWSRRFCRSVSTAVPFRQMVCCRVTRSVTVLADCTCAVTSSRAKPSSASRVVIRTVSCGR